MAQLCAETAPVTLTETPGEVRTTCRKCGEPIRLQFGDMPADAARRVLREMNSGPWECPGYHVELSNRKWYWRLDECFQAVYGEDL